MLSGCQEAVNKLSREKIFFAQTHFLESTNQNTNVNTKIPKNRNRRNFSSGCQEAVKKLSTRCRRAVGPALRENPSSTEVKSCQSAPQGVSIDPCQADTKKFRPALLAVQGVFTLWAGRYCGGSTTGAAKFTLEPRLWEEMQGSQKMRGSWGEETKMMLRNRGSSVVNS